jgi:hypothetical protein
MQWIPVLASRVGTAVVVVPTENTTHFELMFIGVTTAAKPIKLKLLILMTYFWILWWALTLMVMRINIIQ